MLHFSIGSDGFWQNNSHKVSGKRSIPDSLKLLDSNLLIAYHCAESARIRSSSVPLPTQTTSTTTRWWLQTADRLPKHHLTHTRAPPLVASLPNVSCDGMKSRSGLGRNLRSIAICVCACACVRARAYVRARACVRVCVCVCVCARACVCMRAQEVRRKMSNEAL